MDSHPETPQWTAARLAAVKPTWEPDLVRARMLMRPRLAPERRRALYAAVAVATALIVAFVSPSGRAFAQDLWYRWFVTRVAVVRVDLSKIPLDTSIRTDGLQQTVSSLAEAAEKAGFVTHWGRKVLEIRPPVRIDKGAGIVSLLQLLPAAVAASDFFWSQAVSTTAGIRTRARIFKARIVVPHV